MNLKGIDYSYIPVNLKNGDNRCSRYLDLNPAGTVPLLASEDITLHQSVAIIDWLDQIIPEPKLIPGNTIHRARALELSFVIACDIHPINNLRVLKYLSLTFGLTDAQRAEWYQHWVREGFVSIEDLLRRYKFGNLCFGDVPTIAECCLIPQITNALRMGCDLSDFPLSMEIFDTCMKMPAFLDAAPNAQPDYTS